MTKPRKFREGVDDLSTMPEKLRALIDSGQCDSVVNFHGIIQPDGTTRLAMFAAGMTQEDIFNSVCIIRRSMMMMLGMEERDPIAIAAQGDLAPDLIADDEPKPANPNACQGCGRDYWQVLAKCDRPACPKGLYAP